MDLELLERIKRIAVIALVSDDVLMEKLVLKGGNAINIIHNLSSRASIDLDYSMKGDFSEEERNDVQNRIKRSLETTFKDNGFQIIDYSFCNRPEKIDERVKHFWGGYGVEFKILETEKFTEFESIEDARRNAIAIGSDNSTKYSIDISKYEYVDKKLGYDIDGYTLYAYTPEMIICEKIRALCQQIADYKEIVKSITPKSRARDFFDIYTLMNHFGIDLTTDENIDLLRNILVSKNVPVDYIGKISECKELHEKSFAELKDTLKASETLMPFEFYFDFLIKLTEKVSTKIQGR
ncbi:MAG: nucleotidyl transferase AbiEii/AbiGii toxin family protein [Bacteroidales bacterium]